MVNQPIADLSMEQLKIVEKIRGYGADYSSDTGLSLEDQLLACEAVAESTLVIDYSEYSKEQESSLRGSNSSACYLRFNEELANNLLKAISKLNPLNYLTPRYAIAEVLQITFGNARKDSHWLWCAQNYSPRSIIRTLQEMHKGILMGKWSDQSPNHTPADYFTFLLKKRKKRAEIRKRREQK